MSLPPRLGILCHRISSGTENNYATAQFNKNVEMYKEMLCFSSSSTKSSPKAHVYFTIVSLPHGPGKFSESKTITSCKIFPVPAKIIVL
ncbi:hypothetical protein Hamer_G008893, partial [Homarus americanus]